MKDKAFVERWASLPELIKGSFIEKFWLKEDYLADYVNPDETNEYRRSNMIVACALDYSMLSEEQMMEVMGVVRQHLLTPRGLRSLSPLNSHYEPSYADDQRSQDLASRNGSIWIWPLMFYVKTAFKIAGERFIFDAEDILAAFNDEIQTACIGSIGECFEGDPPFHTRGCLSQATSVGSLLNISEQIAEWKAAMKKSAANCLKTKVEKAPVEQKPKRKCVRKK
jgi:glycogen debranching enzyme